MRRINLDVTSIQYEEMSRLMAEKGMNLSRFIREAVDEYIAKMDRQRLEKELEKAYRAKAELNIEICREFEPIEGENT
ncbi:MAG: hypothetical protein JXE07_01720 [Candidatus Aminicenantes bacterium]|nr:hypothetical protein [Candidatus Aminicenantes bacterium]